MTALDEQFVAIAEANPGLRVRVGNPDELRSNKLDRTLDAMKHRVHEPEPGVAESPTGAVITALNEEAVVCAALGNKGGLITLLDPDGLKVDGVAYTQADAELRALAQVDRFDPREVAGAFASQLPIPTDDRVVPGASFWATNATRAPREFLAELAATDYAHAQAGRSYWWFAADEQTGQQSGLMACAGWPGQHEMGWLLAGGRVQPATATDEAQA